MSEKYAVSDIQDVRTDSRFQCHRRQFRNIRCNNHYPSAPDNDRKRVRIYQSSQTWAFLCWLLSPGTTTHEQVCFRVKNHNEPCH